MAQNAQVQVTFNPGSAPSNVTTDNFKVTGAKGDVPGQVTWDANSRTATWVTQPEMPRDSTGPLLYMVANYTATVSGFSGGPYSFTFQTGPCGPPAVYAANTQLFDVPNSGGTFIRGINNNGSFVGNFGGGGSGATGFLVVNGQVTVLKGDAYKVNDHNDVVGWYADVPAGYSKGYLYQNGKYTDIIDPNATGAQYQTGANGINNLGVIVGGYGQVGGSSSGFVRQPDGTYSDFRLTPIDINNLRHILGEGPTGTWLYNGSFNDITIAGCVNLSAGGLNDADDIVGLVSGCPSWNGGPGGGSFIRRGGTVYQIVVPGCQFVHAIGVNNAGTVVGLCGDSGRDHGFIATPK